MSFPLREIDGILRKRPALELAFTTLQLDLQAFSQICHSILCSYLRKMHVAYE